jgi:hypothetical protein
MFLSISVSKYIYLIWFSAFSEVWHIFSVVNFKVQYMFPIYCDYKITFIATFAMWETNLGKYDGKILPVNFGFFKLLYLK